MRNKDYRELQISSSMLIFVFIAIIILGIVIFLLGVSVGKKQATITGQTQFAEVPIEQVQEQKPVTPEKFEPSEQDQKKIDQEIASHAKNKQEQAQKIEKASPRSPNLYYIQVGAYTDRSSASKIAQKYQSMGFKSLVVDPLPRDRRTIYRVRIGGYETREQAQEIKEKLMEKENKKSSDYFIIQGSR